MSVFISVVSGFGYFVSVFAGLVSIFGPFASFLFSSFLLLWEMFYLSSITFK